MTTTISGTTVAATNYTGSGAALTGAGGVLQIKTAIKTDAFTSSSTSFVDVTGISVSITPTASNSKILVLVDYKGSMGVKASVTFYGNLLRDSTIIYNMGSVGGDTGVVDFVSSSGCVFLDSPATTSATTYKIQGRGDGAAWACNRRQGNASVMSHSSITVMEIAAGVL